VLTGLLSSKTACTSLLQVGLSYRFNAATEALLSGEAVETVTVVIEVIRDY